MIPTEKEVPIQRILRRLESELGQDSFTIVPFWEDEADAVGVADPRDLNRLVYICAYPKGFFVSLEQGPLDGDSFDLVTDDEVVAIVKRHLQIT
jgi:hypothetical protein